MRNLTASFVCLYGPEVKIRNAAIAVFNQSISCHSPVFLYGTNHRILPELWACLTLEGKDEMMNIAMNMLTHYCSSCPQEVVLSCVEDLCGKLGALIKEKMPEDTPYTALAESVLKTVTAIADALQTHCEAFCNNFVPSLMELVASLVKTQSSRLRWLALECVAHIGVAVRRQQFIADALTIKDAVLTLLSYRWH